MGILEIASVKLIEPSAARIWLRFDPSDRPTPTSLSSLDALRLAAHAVRGEGNIQNPTKHCVALKSGHTPALQRNTKNYKDNKSSLGQLALLLDRPVLCVFDASALKNKRAVHQEDVRFTISPCAGGGAVASTTIPAVDVSTCTFHVHSLWSKMFCGMIILCGGTCSVLQYDAQVLVLFIGSEHLYCNSTRYESK